MNLPDLTGYNTVYWIDASETSTGSNIGTQGVTDPGAGNYGNYADCTAVAVAGDAFVFKAGDHGDLPAWIPVDDIAFIGEDRDTTIIRPNLDPNTATLDLKFINFSIYKDPIVGTVSAIVRPTATVAITFTITDCVFDFTVANGVHVAVFGDTAFGGALSTWEATFNKCLLKLTAANDTTTANTAIRGLFGTNGNASNNVYNNCSIYLPKGEAINLAKTSLRLNNCLVIAETSVALSHPAVTPTYTNTRTFNIIGSTVELPSKLSYADVFNRNFELLPKGTALLDGSNTLDLTEYVGNDIYWVDPTGGGTPATANQVTDPGGPYWSYSAALAAASSGDAIVFKDGVYTASGNLIKDGVSLIGETNKGATIKNSGAYGTTWCYINVGAGQSNVERLVFEGLYGASSRIVVGFVLGTTPTLNVRNCAFNIIGAEGVSTIFGCQRDALGTFRLIGCEVNYAWNINGTVRGGVFGAGDAISAVGSTLEASNCTVTVWNSTDSFSGVTTAGNIPYLIYFNYGTFSFRNMVVEVLKDTLNILCTTASKITSVDCFSNINQSTAGWTIINDPLLTDTTNYNLELSPNSPILIASTIPAGTVYVTAGEVSSGEGTDANPYQIDAFPPSNSPTPSHRQGGSGVSWDAGTVYTSGVVAGGYAFIDFGAPQVAVTTNFPGVGLQAVSASNDPTGNWTVTGLTSKLIDGKQVAYSTVPYRYWRYAGVMPSWTIADTDASDYTSVIAAVETAVGSGGNIIFRGHSNANLNLKGDGITYDFSEAPARTNQYNPVIKGGCVVKGYSVNRAGSGILVNIDSSIDTGQVTFVDWNIDFYCTASDLRHIGTSGVADTSLSKLRLEGCNFRIGMGNGRFFDDPLATKIPLELIGCTFFGRGNTAPLQGNVLIVSQFTGSTVTAVDCIFSKGDANALTIGGEPIGGNNYATSDCGDIPSTFTQISPTAPLLADPANGNFELVANAAVFV